MTEFNATCNEIVFGLKTTKLNGIKIHSCWENTKLEKIYIRKNNAIFMIISSIIYTEEDA